MVRITNGPRICEVCKGPARGYNYEVASCISCKTFYRRTIINRRIYKCRSKGDCYQDTDSSEKRKSCRACKFAKCIELGMNPLALNLPDLENNSLIQKILRKQQQSGCQPSTSKDSEINTVLYRPLQVFEATASSMLNDLLYVDLRTEMLRRSVYNPNPYDEPGLDGILNRPNVMCSAKILKPMPNWPMAQEYFTSSHPLCNPGAMSKPFVTNEEGRKFWLFFDYLAVIEYAKTLPFFNKLQKSDRLNLLKAVTMPCSNLTQAYYSYVHKSDCLLLPDGTMPDVVHGKVSFGNVNLYDVFQNTTCALIRVGLDHKEYVLLKVIVICNPAVDGLSLHAQKVLTEERNKYTKTLLSYCTANRGINKGCAHFTNTLGIVNVLYRQVELQKNIYTIVSLHGSRILGDRISLINDVLAS